MTDQPTTPAPESNSPKDEIRARAEAANSKVSPWFNMKRLVLPLALITLMVIILIDNSGGDVGTTGPTTGGSLPTLTSEAVAADIGAKVRDGKFEFVVTGVEHPGRTLAGKVGEVLTAQGEFVIVRVDVTNIGTEAQSADCSCQLVFNDKGQKFEPSSAILSTQDALKFVGLIHPGETVEDVLMLFDVAPGTNVVAIELHDSPLTQGVKVKLS